MLNNLENKKLNNLRNKRVCVYLINGICLKGLLEEFNEYVLILKNHDADTEQMIYKHAVSTVVPNEIS